MTNKDLKTALYAIGAVAGGAACLSAGFILGIDYQHNFTMKQFIDQQPLLEKILAELFAQAVSANMNEEEFKQLINSEMNFMRIASQ